MPGLRSNVGKVASGSNPSSGGKTLGDWSNRRLGCQPKRLVRKIALFTHKKHYVLEKHNVLADYSWNPSLK
ncbi:MAG: hypothetical protein AAF387_19995, partial [Pseudomonadota bacterium]